MKTKNYLHKSCFNMIFLFCLTIILFSNYSCVEQNKGEDPDPSVNDDSSDSYSKKAVDKGTIEIGAPIVGTFDESSYHLYNLDITGTSVVTISLKGESKPKLDTVLRIYGPRNANGKLPNSPIDYDDDSGPNNSALFEEISLSEGQYAIVASVHGGKNVKGTTYRLSVECVDGECKGNIDPELWTPNLRSISLQEAEELTIIASQVKFQVKNSSKERRIPWASIVENCNRRASMINFALSQGKQQSVLPEPISQEMLNQIINEPVYDSAQIILTGPFFLRQQFYLSDGTTDPSWDTYVSWDHHIATIVNVDGTLMVIDPSLKQEPITIQEWIYSYIPSNVECPQLDSETFESTKMYYLMRGQFDMEKPETLCGYVFNNPYSASPDEQLTSTLIQEELDDSRELLNSNYDSLKTTIHELTGRNISEEEVPLITSELELIEESEYCRVINYYSKFCRQYQ